MNEIQAYPLCWPLGVPRTKYPEASRFKEKKKTFAGVKKALKLEVERMKAKNLIISTNIPLRMDGEPHSDWPKRKIEDRGVAVYFEYKGSQYVFACDRWKDIWENMHSIVKTIEAIRGIERWGASDMMERSFSGFKALPAAGESTGPSWWVVLGVSAEATEKEISEAYRQLAKKYHPDARPSDPTFWHQVQEAYQQGMARFKKPQT